MAMPGAPNPADGLKEVAKELKEKFDEAGMGKVDEFIDTLEDIKNKAASGPDKIMADVQAKFDELKGNVQKAIDDPSGLVPSAGPAALLASWYAKSVAEKLGVFKADVESLIAQIVKLAEALTEPLSKLGDVIGSAMKELEGTLKKLSKLPAEVGKMAAEIDSPDDIAKIDVEPMKACLKVDGIDGPLTSLGGLGGVLGGAIGMIKEGIQMIMDFITNAADQIKAAFTVPFPCCCCTGPAMAQAPQAFQDMMAMVENLKKIDLSVLLDMLTKTSDTVSGIDVELVKKPVLAFAASAGDSVSKLEKTVQGAKLATNPAGALPGGVGKMIPKGFGF